MKVVKMTERELKRFQQAKSVVQHLRAFLLDTFPESDDVRTWFRYLVALKSLQGNSSNDMSFIACLLAKEYLEQNHGALNFDAAEKAQGAAGLDIDVTTAQGARIVAEVKTTAPYRVTNFGAAQESAFRKDFAKLQAAEAVHKYLFVTDSVAHQVLLLRYSDDLAGLKLVLLDPEAI